jgi:hypothetical protein
MAVTVAAWADDQDPSSNVPAPAGLVATLKLPSVAVIGDHIAGEFIVRNRGSEPVRIRAGERGAIVHAYAPGATSPLNFGAGEAAIDPWLQVHVWSERGRVLPEMIGGAMFLPVRKMPIVTLAPGETKSIYCPLERYVAIVRPDLYTISVWNDLGWQADRNHPPVMATAEMEFRPPNGESVANRVRTLCARDTEENSWELQHLWSPLYLPALRDAARAGHAAACLGMSSLLSEDANRLLLEFAASKDSAVTRAAVYALSTRLPSLTQPAQPALRTWNGWSAREPILLAWQPKFDAPLMSAAVRLLGAPLPSEPSAKKSVAEGSVPPPLIPDSVSLGARVVEARGSAEQVPALLQAAERALETNPVPRKGPQATVPPPPLEALISAIDALRRRGWRTDGQGGVGARLAWFRQLADPAVSRPPGTGWEEAVRTALSAKSPVLRENALRAIGVPLADAWDPLLRKALEDEDGGVLCAACLVAGASGHKDLVGMLVQVIVNAHQPAAQIAAMDAAERLGGGVDVWTALCEVIPEPALRPRALLDLIRGTIDLPPGSVLADGELTAAQATVVREAWKTFIASNRALLESRARVPRGDPSITPTMMLAVRTVQPPQ